VNPVAHLGELLGPHRVSTDPADLTRHSKDASPRPAIAERGGQALPQPLCVVRPRTTDQVRSIVAWANESKTALVPYGGGSGVCTGIAPEGCVVIDTRAMDEILDFDEKSRLVRVQPGMLGPDLMKALRSWGYMLGHEPQSIGISTVGGWIATKAAGQLSARYGSIEDLVVALEAVLPNGEVVRSKTAPRRSAGPDVASLMIGSEGALGVVTEATLRVSPIPDESADRALWFEHMADGVKACRAVAQSELGPTLVRLYDRDDTALLMRNEPEPQTGVLLLLTFDGPGCEARADAAVDLSGGAPGDDGLVGHWWEHRNDLVEEYVGMLKGDSILGPHGVAESIEVSGSWTVLRDLYHSMKKSLEPHADFVGCHLSHIYPDGACLYFSLGSVCDSDEAANAAMDAWWDAAMRSCLDAGGSISHHHGIGRLKAPWLREELGGWWDVLVTIKKALDPNGIMNPGVLGL
jgi:alkyldihydroxyacetonephosphate synthase